MKFHPVIKHALLWCVSPGATRLWFRAKNPPSTEGASPIRAILVLRLDEIGDAVLTSAFLRELRNNYPRAEITLVVKPEVADLAEYCPYVDEILTFDGETHPLFAPFVRLWRAYRLAKYRLWRKDLDLAILPRLDTDHSHATYLAYFSRAKRRIGFTEKATAAKGGKNRGYDRLLTEVLPPASTGHEVEINLSVIRHLGGQVRSTGLELWLDEEDREFARRLLPAGEGCLIALAPGGSSPGKQWPVERYLEVVRRLRDELPVRIVVVGGGREAELGRYLAQRLPEGSCLDLTGKTTLRQTAAVIERCRLYLGNDTGAKHMAAAFGVSVVEISRFPLGGDPMHEQSPARFGAWGCRNIVLQPGFPGDGCDGACFADRAHCILGVDVGAVRLAVSEILETGANEREAASTRDSAIPEISVVIPLYNKATDVARSIRSVLEQTEIDFELIVVDDGSTDGSSAVVASINDRRIRVFRQENAGVSAARNKGIAQSRAELVAFIDADDEWMPDFLSTILRLRRSCPDCDVFVTGYLYSTPDGKKRPIYFQGMPLHPWEGIRELPLSNDFDPPISMSAFAVTKHALLAVGGFPEGISVSEDLLARIRLMLRFKVAYSTNPCSIYWRPFAVAANRKPEYPDLVGHQLQELLPGLCSTKASELRSVIANWHRRRGIMNITFGVPAKARYEIGKAIALQGWNLDLLALSAAARIPCRLSRPMLQALVRVKALRRRLALVREGGREDAAG